MPRALCYLLLLLPAAHAPGAETAYVIDRLLAGIHAQPSLDSEVVKVVQTGTQLEILQRRDPLVEVRTGDGVQGWMDASYLMSETPAAIALAELRSASAASVDRLARENTDLKGRIAAALAEREPLAQRIRALEQSLAESEAARYALPAAPAPAANAELDRLRSENARLGAALRATGGEPARRSRWPWLAAALAGLALAFAAGAWLMDYLQRRRHGGFRL